VSTACLGRKQFGEGAGWENVQVGSDWKSVGAGRARFLKFLLLRGRFKYFACAKREQHSSGFATGAAKYFSFEACYERKTLGTLVYALQIIEVES